MISTEFINEIQPLYNIDDYAKEIKYRLQIAHDKAVKLLDILKIRNKSNYDKTLHKIYSTIFQKPLYQRG